MAPGRKHRLVRRDATAYAPTMASTKTRSRLPTYGAAGRLARIVLGLLSRPHGWPLGSITEELGISERTLLRYLAVCRSELVDSAGRPMIEVVGQGTSRALKLVEHGPAPDAGIFEAV